MFSRVAMGLASRRTTVAKTFSRNIGMTTVCLQKASVATDPIQKLFVDKVHEYAQKSKSSGGKLVDASPAIEKDLKDELEKIARQYGAKGAEFTKFPTFSFVDPDLEPVGVQVEINKVEAEQVGAVAKKEEDDKPFFEP